MIWDGINQRKFPRVSYKCLIRVSKDGKEELIDTFTENIGAGGICVVLDKEFGRFEAVALEIFLSDGESPILCDGTTVWVVKRHPTVESEKVTYDTGIEFTEMSEQDRERVARLVEDILKSKT
ncbi:PilZ domain-containing protein [Candidatus Omnitrophota bacterium]